MCCRIHSGDSRLSWTHVDLVVAGVRALIAVWFLQRMWVWKRLAEISTPRKPSLSRCHNVKVQLNLKQKFCVFRYEVKCLLIHENQKETFILMLHIQCKIVHTVFHKFTPLFQCSVTCTFIFITLLILLFLFSDCHGYFTPNLVAFIRHFRPLRAGLPQQS